MTICDIKRGTRVVVLKVEASEPVRERLCALGIHTGSKITVLKVSLFKRTFLVQAGPNKIALGRDVASEIRVWHAL